jgi:hypothetical protein
MLGKITLAAGLIAIATTLGSVNASATPALPQSKPAAGIGAAELVQQVRHRRHRHRHRLRLFRSGLVIGLIGAYGYCSAWRGECADRHGWRTRRFYRCLWRHGC